MSATIRPTFNQRTTEFIISLLNNEFKLAKAENDAVNCCRIRTIRNQFAACAITANMELEIKVLRFNESSNSEESSALPGLVATKTEKAKTLKSAQSEENKLMAAAIANGTINEYFADFQKRDAARKTTGEQPTDVFINGFKDDGVTDL